MQPSPALQHASHTAMPLLACCALYAFFQQCGLPAAALPPEGRSAGPGPDGVMPVTVTASSCGAVLCNLLAYTSELAL